MNVTIIGAGNMGRGIGTRAVAGGHSVVFVDANPEVAEKAEDIDVERATAKVEEAEHRLQAGGLPSEVKEAQISLEKARLRKKIAERTRKTGHA